MMVYTKLLPIATLALLGCAPTSRIEVPAPFIEPSTQVTQQLQNERKTIYDICDYHALHKLKLSAEEFDQSLPAIYALRQSLEHPEQEKIRGPMFKTEFDALVNIIAKSLHEYATLSEKMNNLCPRTTPDNFKECSGLHSKVSNLGWQIESSARILSRNYSRCIK